MGKTERRDGFQHECELPPEETEFAAASAYNTGYCIGLKRLFMSCMIIWRNHAQSALIYKSDFVIRRTNIQQLQSSNIVIHPFSIFKLFWAIVMVISLVILFILPIEICFEYDLDSYLHTPLTMMNILDIIVTFNSGFLHDELGTVIMNRRVIWKTYLKSWFFPDVIAVTGYAMYNSELIQNEVLTKYAVYLMLLRLRLLFSYMKDIDTSYITNPTGEGLKLILALVITFIWGIKLYYIAFLNDLDWVEINSTNGPKFRIKFFYHFITNIYNMGCSTVNYEEEMILIDTIMCFVGFVWKLILLSFLLNLYFKASFLPYKYLGIRLQMMQFSNVKQLPESIRNKMERHIQHTHKHHKFQEQVILEGMSNALKQEVLSYIYSQLLEKSLTFANVPMEVILKLTNKISTAIFMPADVIIQADTPAEAMFFIKSGFMAAYTPIGKEVSHLKDGGSFGEFAILENENHNYTVVAIDWCEVCVLYRKDIIEVLSKDPDLLHKIRQGIYKRSSNIIQNDDWSNFEEIVSNDSDSSVGTNSTIIQL